MGRSAALLGTETIPYLTRVVDLYHCIAEVVDISEIGRRFESAGVCIQRRGDILWMRGKLRSTALLAIN